jgi:hypothetical protein
MRCEWPAKHAIDVVIVRVTGYGSLVFADELHSVFYALFRVSAGPPVSRPDLRRVKSISAFSESRN